MYTILTSRGVSWYKIELKEISIFMAMLPTNTIKDIVTDFLGSAPSLAEIAAYRLPEELQAYAHNLLEKNRAGSLNEAERAEMEEFRQIDHLLTLVKAKAKLKLKGQD